MTEPSPQPATNSDVTEAREETLLGGGYELFKAWSEEDEALC